MIIDIFIKDPDLSMNETYMMAFLLYGTLILLFVVQIFRERKSKKKNRIGFKFLIRQEKTVLKKAIKNNNEEDLGTQGALEDEQNVREDNAAKKPDRLNLLEKETIHIAKYPFFTSSGANKPMLIQAVLDEALEVKMEVGEA